MLMMTLNKRACRLESDDDDAHMPMDTSFLMNSPHRTHVQYYCYHLLNV